MAARTITHDGVTLTIGEWAKRTNQTAASLRYRLNAGWSINDALFQPPSPYRTGRPSIAGERIEQVRKLQLEREFSKLLFAVDNALRTFRTKLDTLLPAGQTGGWVDLPEKSPSDRTIPAAQDSV